MMLRPPIVVFDLDGTLAETAHDLVATLNMLLVREGFPRLPLTAARPMVGAGARALIQRGFSANGEELSAPRLDLLLREFLAHYEEHIVDETTLFPGALSALDRLAEEGFRLAVCTNKPERLSRVLLSRLGVANHFAAICGRETFPVFKPDPAALLLTIDAAGGDSRRAVMVGDSRTDVTTARNARVPVVAVDFGYTDTPVVELAPDRVISHFDDLWGAVESLRNEVSALRT